MREYVKNVGITEYVMFAKKEKLRQIEKLVIYAEKSKTDTTENTLPEIQKNWQESKRLI